MKRRYLWVEMIFSVALCIISIAFGMASGFIFKVYFNSDMMACFVAASVSYSLTTLGNFIMGANYAPGTR